MRQRCERFHRDRQWRIASTSKFAQIVRMRMAGDSGRINARALVYTKNPSKIHSQTRGLFGIPDFRAAMDCKPSPIQVRASLESPLEVVW